MTIEGFSAYFNKEYQNYLSKNHRFSLRSFAKFLGLAPSTTHQYLSGRYFPSIRNLKIIAEKLNWSDALLHSFRSDVDTRREAPKKKEIFETQFQSLPISEITVKILALSKRKDIPSSAPKLLKFIDISERQLADVEKALGLLQSQDLIDLRGSYIQFQYNIKFISNKTPEGSFLEFQKRLCAAWKIL